MSYVATISKEELNAIPIHAFQGTIHVVERMDRFDAVMPELLQSTLLGFDTETRPSFTKGRVNSVSLLQLATDTTAWLFRVNKIGIPDALAEVLASPKVLKVGNAIQQDIATLCKVHRFQPSSFIDLQQYTEKFGIQDNGLSKLSAIVLGRRISKAQQLSNWENEVLLPPQQLYAATDAWVCYRIYQKLSAE